MPIAVGIAWSGILAISLTACSTSPFTAAPSRSDETFVARMVAHHHLGMTILDDATQHSDGVELRRLAFEMQGYHTSDLEILERRLQDWELSLPEVFPGYVAEERLDELAAMTGTPHDIAWLTVMIEHHEGALRLTKSEIARGDDPELRDLAAAIARLQRAEIKEMTRLRSRLTGGFVTRADRW